MAITLIRYWGSYFKTPRPAREFAAIFANAAARGWRTCLVCCQPPDDPSWLTPLHETGTSIEYLPRPRRNFDAGTVLRVFRLCRRLRCGVFHCDNMHTSPLIGSALAGVPVRLWSKHSMQPAFEEERTPTLYDRLAIAVRVSCLLATRVLPVSGAVRDELVGLGVRAGKCVVFPNPLPEARNANREQARAQLGYRGDELVIATVGHAVPVKGWDVLLKAFQRVASKLARARLLLVGSTSAADERPCFQHLQELIDNFELAGRVQFAGHVPDVATALSAADVFAIPSRSEGYCNALLEAMSAGLPCVSTRVGVAEEAIRPGENGLLVQRGDVPGLADALLTLGRDPDLGRRFGLSAENTRVTCSPEEYAQRLVDLYASLLTSAGRSVSASDACQAADLV